MTTRPTAPVFAGLRFPPQVITAAVRWYLRYGLSYWDVGELLADQRINAENRTLRLENRKLTTGNQQLTERIKAARENNRFLDTRIARLEADLAEFLLAGQRAPAQPS